MKKIISILCLIPMLMQYAVIVRATASEITTEQEETVYQLGIMNRNQDVDGDTDEGVTRADFAEIVYRLLYDSENVSGATKSYYKDVDIYHYAAYYIQTLTERGITYGCDDGNFYPAKNITVGEAVTMILRAIGYDILFSMGENVKSVASDVGIGSGMNFDEELTRTDAADIIYDALYADTLKASLPGNEVSRSEMVMYELLGLQYKDGVVDGIDGRSLYGHYIPEGTVSVDENKYEFTCEVDESLLGKYVRFYYNEEDEKVKAIVPRRNSILSINAESIIEANNTEITYYNEDRKRKTAKIASEADFLCNENVINDISQNIPRNGEIKLIDRKDDGSYDVVFITEYTSYLVSRTDVHDETITLYNTDEKIKLRAYDESEILDINNVSLEPDAITPNTVISVFKSGTKHIKVLKSDAVITGTITAISEDDYGRKVINLGENRVSLHDNCYLGGVSLSIGANVAVYMDAFGIGAAVKNENKDDWEFGYLISAKEDYETLMEDSIRLKVLTMDGEQEIMYLVDKTRIDGNVVQIGNVMTRLNNLFNNFADEISGGEEHKKELVTTRLIRFRRTENIIYQLDAPMRFGLYEESESPAMTQNDKLLLRVKGNLYLPENKLGFKAVYTNYTDLQGELFYTDNTPVFVVPTAENTEADEDDYAVIPGKELRSTYGEFIYMSAYYTDINNFVPDAIVVRKDTFRSSETSLLVVNKVKNVWDEQEEEVVTQIEGYINGSLTAMAVNEKDSAISLSDIKSGDCIAYDMYDGKLKLTQLMYRADGGGALNGNYFWSKNGESLFNTSFRALIGRAGNIAGNYMHLKIDSESKIDELISLPSNIAFYDSSDARNSIYVGDYLGISANDIVIVSSRQGVQQDVIVIK